MDGVFNILEATEHLVAFRPFDQSCGKASMELVRSFTAQVVAFSMNN
jgi:hypothetical protein